MHEELVKRLRNCGTQIESCNTCDLVEDAFCSDTLMKQAADAIEELSKRVPPVPHGRLIDADAVEKQIDYVANIDWNKAVGVSNGMLAALEIVEDAPTVIEAEEANGCM